ncbi:hypothetical protein [Nocardioides sp. CFH 31398]|uniref:hypothetical protein n=1 Tax=Nocardioides sp. CFH 31398 TaxID=2919579 RepID=UPI001F06B838|nr:hypothetical protein [Nocardioides sp. CFH 31398]MCH1865389.1 hypothetical protein [Nocardioides sp. CFH 31398]
MRATRVVAALATGLLALGPAPAPSATATTAVEMATPRGDEPRRVDVVRDPRGDGEVPGPLRGGPRSYERLADITRSRYKTPSRVDGDLRITTTWAYLADARDGGARRQLQFTTLRVTRDLAFYVTVRNTDDRVVVQRFATSTGQSRVNPEKVEMRRDFGRDGTVDLILSTEWLGARSLTFLNTATSGRRNIAFDRVRASKPLDVGPLR